MVRAARGELLRWARAIGRVDSHRCGGIGRASIVGAGVGCATPMNNYRPADAHSIHCQGRLFAFSRSSIGACCATRRGFRRRARCATHREKCTRLMTPCTSGATRPQIALLCRKWVGTNGRGGTRAAFITGPRPAESERRAADVISGSISTWLWFITSHHSQWRFIWKNERFIGAVPAARIFIKLTALINICCSPALSAWYITILQYPMHGLRSESLWHV